jgi:hypothetical protein
MSEPNDLETLYMRPRIKDDSVTLQSIAIAPLKNRTLSLIASKWFKNKNSFVHIFFTEEEVDKIIEALQEAKKRWYEEKVVKKFKIIYSDGYWELHDGTMMGNGDPMPLLAHEDKNFLIAVATTLITNEALYIHKKNGLVESKIEFPIKP